MLNHIDLFSGVGGFALAAMWAGIQTVQFVEFDKFCQKILKKNFPGVPIHDDIKTFHYTGASPFILTGGFPCQPFSCAGKRGGKADSRYLWPEMLRVVSEIHPAWIVGENVTGIISMELDNVCADLENKGYEVQPFIIPACAVNAPHRRDRVWIIANRKKPECKWDIDSRGRFNRFTNKTCHAPNSNQLNGHNAGFSASEVPQLEETEVSFMQKVDSHASSERLEGSQRFKPHDQEQAAYGSTPECNSAWNETWLEATTRICGIHDGIPRRVDRTNRLKALGNSIVPQIAYIIFESIKALKAGGN